MEEVIMNKIIPHLWYDKEAKEAALYYISLFENSKLLNVTVIENTPFSKDRVTIAVWQCGRTRLDG